MAPARGGLQIVRRAASQFALDHGQGREGALHAEPQRPSATSATATSGSTLRPRISSAKASREPSVSATRTVTQPACWLADTSLPTVATRTGSS